MAGGMRMQAADYDGTPRDLERLEALHDRLEALMKAKAHLAQAHEWLELEGVLLHGSIKDMMDQVDLMKYLIHQAIIYGEE